MIPALATLMLVAALPAQALTSRSGPYEMQVLVGGVPARTFQHDGESFVLGHLGERYTLRIVNHGSRRVEAVVSVDGRDVIDGKPADWRTKRGYLVPAGGSVEIDGWRISQQEAAAFRFSTVPDSYAARTGSAREVGVIGVAIFPERWQPRPLYPVPITPWHGDRRDRLEGRNGEDSAPEAHRKGSAPTAEAEPLARKPANRPGLGTEFGEPVLSHVREVAFQRAFERPEIMLGARYDDRAGLRALGIEIEDRAVTEVDLRRSADPFPVVERGYAAPPPGWHRW